MRSSGRCNLAIALALGTVVLVLGAFAAATAEFVLGGLVMSPSAKVVAPPRSRSNFLSDQGAWTVATEFVTTDAMPKVLAWFKNDTCVIGVDPPTSCNLTSFNAFGMSLSRYVVIEAERPKSILMTLVVTFNYRR